LLEELTLVRMRPATILALVPAGHRLAGNGQSITSRDLVGETDPVAPRSVDPERFDRISDAFREDGVKVVEVPEHHIQAVATRVQRDGNIGLVTDWMVGDLDPRARDELTTRPFQDPVLDFGIYLITLEGPSHPLVEPLMEMATEPADGPP
jgi:hypothetical protein